MRTRALGVGLAAVVLTGCGSDGSTATTNTTASVPSTTSTPRPTEPVTVRLTFTNVSGGSETPTGLAPGLVVVHEAGETLLFSAGEADVGAGLEQLAEDGDPTGLAEAIGAETFQKQEGGYDAGPLMPAESVSVDVTITPGQMVSFAAMFGESNDWFFAPGPDGLDLFDDDWSLLSDVTDQVAVWDAGTEADQPVGEGPDQAPRQDEKGAGDPDPDTTIRRVSDATDHLTVTVELVSEG